MRYAQHGTFKRTHPLRADCKQRIVNAILELEVPKPDITTLKMIRYPVEDGNEIQNVIQTRSNQIQTQVSVFSLKKPFLTCKRLLLQIKDFPREDLIGHIILVIF